MSVRRIDLAGSWPDVAGDVLTYVAGVSVVAVRVHPSTELETLWSQAGPEALMTLRHAVSPSGEVCVVGKSHESGDVVVVRPGRWDAVAQAHGDNPCAVYWADGFIVVFIERAKPGAGPLVRALRVANGEEVWSRKLIPAPDGQFSSQGILDLGLDGSPIFTDARRVLNGVAGWAFTKPNVRDGIIVGQTDPPAIRIAVAEHVFTALAASDGMAENPHLSVFPDGRILVSAYTLQGASLAIVDPPYPAHEPAPKLGDNAPDSGTPPPPTITITAYPTSVEVNAPARAVAALSGGPADRVIWLFRPAGDPNWTIAAVNNPSDADHSFHFAAAGPWEIGVRVEGPGGSNQTGKPRVITVTAPHIDPIPSPMRDNRVWFQPNIASDFDTLVTQDILGNVHVLEIVAQHLISDPVVQQNTWQHLLDLQFFQRLHAQGIHFSLGMSAVTEFDPDGSTSLADLERFVEQFRADTGLDLECVSIDVPMTKNQKWIKAPMEVLADRVATFIKKAHALKLKVAWAESWPEVSIDDQWKFLDLLDARADDNESLPNWWSLDIDHLRRLPDAHMIEVVNNVRSDFGISTAVMLAGYAHPTDQLYEQDVLAWARQVKALGLPTTDRIFVGSWVAGFQQPNNFTHIALLNQVVELFA